jgi:uncharacterized repeat protein (TIGR03803 family)
MGGNSNLGVIFKLARDGTFSVLHYFADPAHGINPNSGLVADAQGNLLGTAAEGANFAGIAYKLATDGTYTVVHDFGSGSNDAAFPTGTPVLDAQGNLYGVAGGGVNHAGTIYRIAHDGTETVLYAFKGAAMGDGAVPTSIALIRGRLYGVTEGMIPNPGTVFRYDLATGAYRTIYTFKSHRLGQLPVARITLGPDGALYGTTSSNGRRPNAGTVFRLVDN